MVSASDPTARSAAIVTVGSELVAGLRIDTNTSEIARTLVERGFAVEEAVSVADDAQVLARVLGRLCERISLVVVTGGLGPTHDDITREAASAALGIALKPDAGLQSGLASVVARHATPEAAVQVLAQALVLEGAEVLPATTGTAPGQLVQTSAGVLALLPGPPAEMRPMLATIAARYPRCRAQTIELGVVGTPESDAQLAAQRALSAFPLVGLTVLAKPGDVRILLLDQGAGETVLNDAAARVADEIGDNCYSRTGESLAQVVVRCAGENGLTLATAESCTGGGVGECLTRIPGASDVYLGGVVSYSNESKKALLGVDESALAQHGAVSELVALQMAQGARRALGSDVAIAVTGVAGPAGGSATKPVGLVWFAIATAGGAYAREMQFGSHSTREAIRMRAIATALDLLRREIERH